MTLRWPIICMACTRLHDDLETCDAYPRGIPSEILDGQDHRRARGDEVGGLVFNKGKTQGADVAMDAWAGSTR